MKFATSKKNNCHKHYLQKYSIQFNLCSGKYLGLNAQPKIQISNGLYQIGTVASILMRYLTLARANDFVVFDPN